jgi:ACS family tartrate transporter-like MFS transporter
MGLDPDVARVRFIAWRIVPLLAAVLLLSYLDKVNIGFAALQMNKALGLSNSTFGLAAGLFALSYALAAIPSTILLRRVGARRWISWAMLVWGLCSAATAFVASPKQLMLARVALGAAEAGFTPGVIFYLNSWFPKAYRGRILGSFLAILPVSIVVGGPLSSALLSWDGLLGFSGWQWLFLIEGLPTVLLALAVRVFLADTPDDARWLSAKDLAWLKTQLDAEANEIAVSHAAKPSQTGSRRALLRRRAAHLGLVYLGISTSGAGALMFLPLLIRAMGFSMRASSALAAFPALISAAMLPLWGYWTDRAQRREWVVAATCLSLCVGLAGTAIVFPSPWALIPLTLAFIGYFGSVAPFWTLPSSFLTGVAAAASIAAINVTGNIGAFFGPALLGSLSDRFGSYSPGLYLMAIVALGTSIGVLISDGKSSA